MSWHLGPMCPFDLETTGVDVEEDRIVTAAVLMLNGRDRGGRTWLLNPGIDIPAEATKVHGVSTAQAQAEGVDAAKGVEEIAVALAEAVTAGVPLVGHNLPYDLTLLDRECRRHHLGGLEDLIGRPVGPVIDTRVLDQHVLPYRRRPSKEQGARQLVTVAQVFQLPWDEVAAHSSHYDALQSARIAWWIGEIAHRPARAWPDWARAERSNQFSEVAGLTLQDLHDRQVGWAAEQAAGLEEYLRKSDDSVRIDRDWPMRPFRKAVASSGVALPP